MPKENTDGCDSDAMSPLLSVRGLRVEYSAGRASNKQKTVAICGLDLDVMAGETLAVVGESGAGKSTLAQAVVGLTLPGRGSIRFDGTELVGLRGRTRREVRRRLQMVSQNPLLSLSPRRQVSKQIEEPLLVHTHLCRSRRRQRVDRLLDALDLGPAIGRRLPHELSGGQAQRVVLARALILEPSMILFDEPTSALDVSVQAGVLNLIRQLKAKHGLTYLFITHDLGVAHHLANRIAVMRAGRIVEQQETGDLFANPRHPYTKALLRSSLTLP